MKRIPRSLSLLILLCPLAAPAAQVTLQRVPDNGLEPQVQVDSSGTFHLMYFAGDDKAGNVFYCTSSDGGKTFARGRPVNDIPNSAIIVGSVRGPRMAIDSNDHPHVIWTGNDAAQPKPRLHGLALLYARHVAAASKFAPNANAPAGAFKFNAAIGAEFAGAADICTAPAEFEPQRNIIPAGVGIDGGASIAADRNGNIDIIWHAPEKHDGDEQSRKLWLARSSDDFASRTALPMPAVGICGCCGVHAFYDDADARQIIFRAADKMVHRDMYLLSNDGAFRMLSDWRIGKCVMSTSAASGNFVAWESRDKIFVSDIAHRKPTTLGRANPKHPAIALSRDHVLVAWTENTAWHKGGSVAWQVLDRDLKPVEGEAGRADDLPAWDYPAAFAKPDGSFVILY